MHDGTGGRRAVRAEEGDGPGVSREDGMWRIRSLSAARQVLGARTQTTQAGFTAEAIPQRGFRHRPILIADGPQHDAQRKKVGRFFAPTVVARSYTDHMHERATALLDDAQRRGVARLDQLALLFTVEITRRAVGLEHSSVRGMARRLERFFTQPPFDLTRPGLGRTRRQWMRAAWNGLVPLLAFWLADVRPAVRALRRKPGENVVSHLIAEGYSSADILVECVTYGTAGMVTTREFIVMACWHLLDDDRLRERYLVADQPERLAIIEEIIRLEPVVGHLYRRVREPFEITHDGRTHSLAAGDLVDVMVRWTNTDAETFPVRPHQLCPDRDVPAGVDRAGLTFSDGAHRCPGRALALTETDVFLLDLLRRRPAMCTPPAVGWDQLVAGYTLRGMILQFESDRVE